MGNQALDGTVRELWGSLIFCILPSHQAIISYADFTKQ